jgi:hypothetical protein
MNGLLDFPFNKGTWYCSCNTLISEEDCPFAWAMTTRKEMTKAKNLFNFM